MLSQLPYRTKLALALAPVLLFVAAITTINLATQVRGVLPPVNGGTGLSSYFDFASQIPGGTLAPGNNSITLRPVPFGVNGTDLGHYLRVYQGTGTAEACLITGGVGTSGSTTGAIIINCANSHSGSWKVASASSGIFEGFQYLSATGGRLQLAAGTSNLYQTLNLGNGSGTTESTTQNIWIEGAGKGGEEFVSPSVAGSDLVWLGPTGGTMVKTNGPLHSVALTKVRLNGSTTAAKYIDIYATAYSNFEWNSYVGLQAGGVGISLESGGGANANSMHNSFRGSYIDATSSGSGCFTIGLTPTNFNSGNFQNDFSNLRCTYANDTSDSNAIVLGWADNNNFVGTELVSVSRPGSGAAVKNIRQTSPYDWLPSENTFVHTTLCGDVTCIGVTGDAGYGIGNIFWPYQTFDSGGLGSGKNARGWLTNGDFFDTSPVSRMAFQKGLSIYTRSALAQLKILGFLTTGSGTVSSSGTALTGSGTSFLTLPGLKGVIAINSNEFRTLTAIADNTHATLDIAFTDDAPASTAYLYGTGANGFLYSDGHINLGTQNAKELRFWTGGQEVGVFDTTGNLNAYGKLSGNESDTTFNNAGGNTITVGQLIDGNITRSSGGAQTDTTPTATQIVAAFSNCQIGQTFGTMLFNNSGGLHTLGLGTGVTIAAGFTSDMTTATTKSRLFKFRVTNISSPAVTVYSPTF